MRSAAALGCCIAVVLCLPGPAAALEDGLARTPPMGWSSWNHFDCRVDEQVVRQTADAMVQSGMRDAGYRYVNVDDCWMAGARDASGRLQADPERFPSGIPALARYVHQRGLRLGLYTDLGTRTCAGRPGLAGHEEQDVRTMTSWGIDYLKVDFCQVPPDVFRQPAPAYARVRDALRRSGRRVVLSICNWGVAAPWRWGAAVGHLWRTTGDIRDSWRSVMRIAGRNGRLARYAGPGGWNDPDMLQVGNGGMSSREDRAHFSLWAMMAAPLIAGNDVRLMSGPTRRTLLNREVIAVDQDRRGAQGRRVQRGRHEVWVKRLRGGGRAVLLLNRGRRRARLRFDLRRLGVRPARSYRVRDLWARRWRRTGRVLRARVPSHGVALFRVGRR